MNGRLKYEVSTIRGEFQKNSKKENCFMPNQTVFHQDWFLRNITPFLSHDSTHNTFPFSYLCLVNRAAYDFFHKNYAHFKSLQLLLKQNWTAEFIESKLSFPPLAEFNKHSLAIVQKFSLQSKQEEETSLEKFVMAATKVSRKFTPEEQQVVLEWSKLVPICLPLVDKAVFLDKFPVIAPQFQHSIYIFSLLDKLEFKSVSDLSAEIAAYKKNSQSETEELNATLLNARPNAKLNTKLLNEKLIKMIEEAEVTALYAEKSFLDLLLLIVKKLDFLTDSPTIVLKLLPIHDYHLSMGVIRKFETDFQKLIEIAQYRAEQIVSFIKSNKPFDTPEEQQHYYQHFYSKLQHLEFEFDSLPEFIKKKKDLYIPILKRNPRALRKAPNKVKSDAKVLLPVATGDGKVICDLIAPSKTKTSASVADKDSIKLAVTLAVKKAACLNYAAALAAFKPLQEDAKFLLKWAQEYDSAIFAHHPIEYHPKNLKAAPKAKGWLPVYLAPSLQNDKSLIESLMSIPRQILIDSIDESLQKEEEWMLTLYKKNVSMYMHMSLETKLKNPDFVKSFMKQGHEYLFYYVPFDLRKNENFVIEVIEACKYPLSIYPLLPKELNTNTKVIEKVLQNNGKMLGFFNLESIWQHSKPWFGIALQSYPYLLSVFKKNQPLQRLVVIEKEEWLLKILHELLLNHPKLKYYVPSKWKHLFQ